MSRLFSRAAYFPAREKELPRAESRGIARAGERNLRYGGSFFARATALPAAPPPAAEPHGASPWRNFPRPPRSFRVRCTPPPAHCHYSAFPFYLRRHSIARHKAARSRTFSCAAGFLFFPPPAHCRYSASPFYLRRHSIARRTAPCGGTARRLTPARPCRIAPFAIPAFPKALQQRSCKKDVSLVFPRGDFPAREKELPRAESRGIARAGERNLRYGGSFCARATALPAAPPPAADPHGASPWRNFPRPPPRYAQDTFFRQRPPCSAKPRASSPLARNSRHVCFHHIPVFRRFSKK